MARSVTMKLFVSVSSRVAFASKAPTSRVDDVSRLASHPPARLVRRVLVPRAFPTDARPHARSVSLSHPRISGRSHVFYPLLSLSAPIHIRARRFVRSQSYLLSHDPSLIFP